MAFPKSQKQADYLKSKAGQDKLTDAQKDDVDLKMKGEQLPPSVMHDKPYTGNKRTLPGILKSRIAVRRALKAK